MNSTGIHSPVDSEPPAIASVAESRFKYHTTSLLEFASIQLCNSSVRDILSSFTFSSLHDL